MEIDYTTLNDLSILHTAEDVSVIDKINFCTTSGGREKLYQNFCTPLSSIEAIQGVQKTLQLILQKQTSWPKQISNGSVMVIEKFYSTTIDEIPDQPSAWSTLAYKILHGPDFSFVKYSTEHAFDFLKGMTLLTEIFYSEDCPPPFKKQLKRAIEILDRPEFEPVKNHNKSADLSLRRQMPLAHFVRYRYKHNMQELLDIYYQLDAWYGMAMAVKTFGLSFPKFSTTQQPLLSVKGLYHLLLSQPVAYNIELIPEKNFLFLTGANMAGKSTFIKSVGTAVFMAHVGMGVPAQSMELSLFDGLLSNINVMDNILRGESYFYNEVQRIKATVQKISDGRHWLILIDELFKGTNVQDAMKCSTAVIEGFLKIKTATFILSTHLYEIGEPLRQYPNIRFNYFETSVDNDQLLFNYHLQEGISNDRLGYLILRNEGVVKMLQDL
ncbi:MAG: hypothetical protein RL115_824 [Bacteroidota bacterium]|jgi:DNA mismatch repair ATPase MutS